MPAIAPIKILKPKVKPRKMPVIEANKIETIKVIPKIVNCNFVYSSFLESKLSRWVAMPDLLSLMIELSRDWENWTFSLEGCSSFFLFESTDVNIVLETLSKWFEISI